MESPALRGALSVLRLTGAIIGATARKEKA
jgi:hypothetical protein